MNFELRLAEFIDDNKVSLEVIGNVNFVYNGIEEDNIAFGIGNFTDGAIKYDGDEIRKALKEGNR